MRGQLFPDVSRYWPSVREESGHPLVNTASASGREGPLSARLGGWLAADRLHKRAHLFAHVLEKDERGELGVGSGKLTLYENKQESKNIVAHADKEVE